MMQNDKCENLFDGENCYEMTTRDNNTLENHFGEGNITRHY